MQVYRPCVSQSFYDWKIIVKQSQVQENMMKSRFFCKKAFIASIVSACYLFIPIHQAYAEKSSDVGLQTVATGLTAPVSGVAAPGDSQHLYVVDQIGEVYKINLGNGQKRIFLDVKNLLVPLGLPVLGGYDERGLLGLAFHPNFATNHLFHTFTTEKPGIADFPSIPVDHDNVIREWNATVPGLSRVVLRHRSYRYTQL